MTRASRKDSEERREKILPARSTVLSTLLYRIQTILFDEFHCIWGINRNGINRIIIHYFCALTTKESRTVCSSDVKMRMRRVSQIFEATAERRERDSQRQRVSNNDVRADANKRFH